MDCNHNYWHWSKHRSCWWKTNCCTKCKRWKRNTRSETDWSFYRGIDPHRLWYPHPRKRSHSHYCWKRVHTTPERRINCDEMHKSLTRGKRRNLPNTWDDLMTRKSCGWKDSTKRKKQWK